MTPTLQESKFALADLGNLITRHQREINDYLDTIAQYGSTAEADEIEETVAGAAYSLKRLADCVSPAIRRPSCSPSH